MSAHEAAPAAAQGVAARRPTPERLISLLGLTLALGYLAVLVTAALGGNFLLDGEGRPIANDFVNVLAAGRLALDGNPAAAYEWTLHKAAAVRAVGHAFANYYGWHYPPPFLFVATALATLPYLVAALVWLAATLTAYAATLGGILRSRAGILLALGFPAALWNVTAGQNGFLTAALIGGTLGLLARHPALAGLCLGFLAYKPQFGLLFPIVLIADRRWLTIAVAALAAGGLAAASWLAFGSASWEAFLHWMPITGRVVLGEGAADWSRLQSLFGLMRAHGVGEAWAWTVQSLILWWRPRRARRGRRRARRRHSFSAAPSIATRIFRCRQRRSCRCRHPHSRVSLCEDSGRLGGRSHRRRLGREAHTRRQEPVFGENCSSAYSMRGSAITRQYRPAARQP
jgi:hypothetical protein